MIDFNDLIKQAKEAGFKILPEALSAALVEVAHRHYAHSDDVEFDVEARISASDRGAFVAAWVWVNYSELDGVEEPEDDGSEDAMRSARLLVDAYRKAEDGGSVDWDDVDKAHMAAQIAVTLAPAPGGTKA